MSQGDYIQWKKRITELQEQSKLPSVLSNQSYIAYKAISLEKCIEPVDKYSYDKLLPDTARTVGGILRINPTACPVFYSNGSSSLNGGIRPNRNLSPSYMFSFPLPVSEKTHKIAGDAKMKVQIPYAAQVAYGTNIPGCDFNTNGNCTNANK